MNARDPSMTIATDDPPFASAHAALMFAFNFDAGRLPETPHAKLVKPGGGSGKGLSGIDGAGQAGMVLAEVARLGDRRDKAFVDDLVPHFLAARFSPHSMPCSCRQPCCSGSKPSPSWWAATAVIGAAALKVSSRRPNYRLAHGLTKRYFGVRLSMTELATAADVSRDTAAQVYDELLKWLREEERLAMYAIGGALQQCGMVAIP